jgi:hypothetical protein
VHGYEHELEGEHEHEHEREPKSESEHEHEQEDRLGEGGAVHMVVQQRQYLLENFQARLSCHTYNKRA